MENPTEPVSKKQLKRLAKAERSQEIRKQKKLEKKEAKQQHKANERGGEEEEDYNEPFPSLPYEPRNPMRLERKSGLMKSTTQAAQQSPRIAIDINGFEELMTHQEKASMVSQVSYSYAANKSAPIPAQLHIVGKSPFLLERLQRMGSEHWKEWNALLDDRPLQEVFPDKSQLVYLSADSENEIQELDPSKVYIIGGIVDRNRHKNLCSTKATELGLTTAKFSLQKHHPNSGARVLTTNHCVDILLEFLASQQWPQAFQRCIPVRKIKDRAAKKEGDGEEEEEQEEEEQEEKPKEARRKRGVIMGADYGVGMQLAKLLYGQNWDLVLCGSDRNALHNLVKNELTSNQGVAVYSVINSLEDGDSARMKEVVFHRFQDKKMDLLVLNECSGDARNHFTAKACAVRELKRFFNPKQNQYPKSLLVQATGTPSDEEYVAWMKEFKARLAGDAGVLECSNTGQDLNKVLEWIGAVPNKQ